jgi:hypothetical protein
MANQNTEPVSQNALPQNDGTPVLEEEKTKKLSKIERKKLRVITKLINGEINGTEAAKKLDLTTRQIRNLKRQVLTEGEDGVIHKNKNYKPYNTYDEEISSFICKLYRKEYRGVNFSEFARVAQEEYHVEASRSTIYNFLRRGHIRSPQRKAKKKTVFILLFDEQNQQVFDKFGNPVYLKTMFSPKKIPEGAMSLREMSALKKRNLKKNIKTTIRLVQKKKAK